MGEVFGTGDILKVGGKQKSGSRIEGYLAGRVKVPWKSMSEGGARLIIEW